MTSKSYQDQMHDLIKNKSPIMKGDYVCYSKGAKSMLIGLTGFVETKPDEDYIAMINFGGESYPCFIGNLEHVETELSIDVQLPIARYGMKIIHLSNTEAAELKLLIDNILTKEDHQRAYYDPFDIGYFGFSLRNMRFQAAKDGWLSSDDGDAIWHYYEPSVADWMDSLLKTRGIAR